MRPTPGRGALAAGLVGSFLVLAAGVALTLVIPIGPTLGCHPPCGSAPSLWPDSLPGLAIAASSLLFFAFLLFQRLPAVVARASLMPYLLGLLGLGWQLSGCACASFFWGVYDTWAVNANLGAQPGPWWIPTWVLLSWVGLAHWGWGVRARLRTTTVSRPTISSS